MVENLLTDSRDREAAVNTFDRNIFLAAGAGSGKTRVLVDRYVKMLEDDLAGVPEIVAITFTEKAAAEMRKRIRLRCTEKIDSLGHDEEQRRKWERHRCNLESAPISTIHSLCTRLLKENPVAAGIDPGFNVLDETQARMLLTETVEEFFVRRLTEDPDTAPAALASLVAEYGALTLLKVLSMALSDAELCSEWLDVARSPQELAEQWHEAAFSMAATALPLLLATQRVRDALNTVCFVEPLDESDKLAQLRDTALEPARTLSASGNFSPDKLTAAIGLSGLRAPGNAGAAAKWPSAEELAKMRESLRVLSQAFKPLDALREEHFAGGSFQRCAQQTALLMDELRLIHCEFQNTKKAQSLLSFDDLQLSAHAMLKSSPATRQRYQEKFRQVMVDEFQDTSRLQTEIAWMLAGSANGCQEPPAGRLFVVGDAKQSIYRFRGADVTVFNSTRDAFDKSPTARVFHLSANFRSQPSLLEFFNESFSDPALMGTDPCRPAYEVFYEPLDPSPDRPESVVPPVHVQVVRSAVNRGEEEPEDGDSELLSLSVLREWEGDALARRIQDLVGSGTKVYDRDARQLRPVCYGDIAILFRSMTDASLYERALRLSNVPYYIEAGRGFFQRLEIVDILSILQHLERPDDAFHLAAVLRCPCVAISDVTLYWLSTGRGLLANFHRIGRGEIPDEMPLSEPELEKLQFAATAFGRLRSIKNRLPLSRLIEEVLNATGMTAVLLTQFNGERAAANLRKLTEVAREVERSGLFSLQDFIRHLDDLRLEEERESEAAVEEEGGNVVRILTIHKSKGLQFPVVILPDLLRGKQWRQVAPVMLSRTHGIICKVRDGRGTRVYPGVTQLFHDDEAQRDLAESRRLLYVGMTRAGDHLLLSGAHCTRGTRQPKPEETWMGWISSAVELGLFATDSQRVREDKTPSSSVSVRCDILPVEGEVPFRRTGRHHPPLAGEMTTALQNGEPLSNAPPDAALQRRISSISPDWSALRTLSVTQLLRYMRCPHHFYLRNLEGIPDMPVGPQEAALSKGNRLSAAERGTLIHRVLQAVSLTGSASIPQAVADSLAEIVQRPDDLLRRAEMELLQVAEHFLRSAVVEWLEEVDTQSVELPFSCLVGDYVVEGIIDWGGETSGVLTHLLDYKTGKDLSTEKKAEYQFQLGLYAHALELAGNTLRRAGIYFVDENRLEEFDVHSSVRHSVEMTVEACGRISDGNFAPCPGEHCAFCQQAWACSDRE